jgi:hypothetical protein
MWPQKPQGGSQRELHEHVEGGDEERGREAKVFVVEHPLVVQRDQGGEEEPMVCLQHSTL